MSTMVSTLLLTRRASVGRNMYRHMPVHVHVPQPGIQRTRPEVIRPDLTWTLYVRRPKYHIDIDIHSWRRNMEARQRHSRKQRAITVCTECHRRKQKCDRAYPCNFCTSRSVPGRCSYVQGHVPSNRSSSRKDLNVPPARAPTTPEAADRIRTPESPPPPPPPAAGREIVAELLREQVGYSHSNFGHNLASWEQVSLARMDGWMDGLNNCKHLFSDLDVPYRRILAIRKACQPLALRARIMSLLCTRACSSSSLRPTSTSN